ncbi:ABC transporter ATP-binding protein [bacterium]|nr:ABC transporter ATP-binding protein [bacterium]
MIEAQKLNFRYASGFCIKDLDLAVHRGAIVGFIGRNGAGKTTVIRMLLGLQKPESGSIVFEGKVLSRVALARIGFLIERPAIYDHLTAAENLRVSCALLKLPLSHITDALALADADFGAKQVRHFSVGMRQKLGFALAVLRKPALLLLDEPLTGLDPQSSQDMLGTIQRFAAQGGAVLFSCHQLHEVEQIATDVAIIDHGQIRYRGSAAALRACAGWYVRCASATAALEALSRCNIAASAADHGVHVAASESIALAIKMLVAANVDIYEVVQNSTLSQLFFGIVNEKGAAYAGTTSG